MEAIKHQKEIWVKIKRNEFLRYEIIFLRVDTMEREVRYKINKTRKKVKIETLINQYI